MKNIKFYLIAVISSMIIGVSAQADAPTPEFIFNDFESSVSTVCDVSRATVERTDEQSLGGGYSVRVKKGTAVTEDFGYNVLMKKGRTYRIGAFLKIDTSARVTASIGGVGLSLDKGVQNDGWTLYYKDYRYSGATGSQQVCFSADATEYFADRVFVVSINDGVTVTTSGAVKTGSNVKFNLNGYSGRYYYNIIAAKGDSENVLDNGFVDNGVVQFTIPTIAEGGNLIFRYSPVSADGQLDKYTSYNAGIVGSGTDAELSVNGANKVGIASDFVDEQYNYDYSADVVPYASATFAWQQGNAAADETGSLKCTLKESFRSSPYYKVTLVKGKTYKIKTRIKVSADIPPEIFNFHITGTDADGNAEGYLMSSVQNIKFEKDKWVDIESYLTWNGQIGSTDTVNIKFRIGSGTWQEFFGEDSEQRSFTYYVDYFSLMPYMPDVNVRRVGDSYVNGSVRLESSCDKVMLHSYPLMYDTVFVDGYDGAVYFYKVDGAIVDVLYGKDSSFANKQSYIGKRIKCEVYPVIYGKVGNRQELDAGVAAFRENSYKVSYFDKVLNPMIDLLRGKVDAKVYDGSSANIYSAAYSGDSLIDVSEGDEFEINAKGADRASTYVWSDNLTPLTDKTNIVYEPNSKLIYVDSADGNDENNGSYDAPYKTIQRAKEEVRTIIRESDAHGDVRWHYDNGVLQISGGTMNDYTFDSPAPWSEYKSVVRTLIINDGVTKIGDYAFYGFSDIKNAVIADSVVSIGEKSFSGCSRLSVVVLSDNVSTVEAYAFDSNTSVCVSNTSCFANCEGYSTFVAGENQSSFLSENAAIGWAVYEDVLVFTGTGSAKAAITQSDVPWKDYRAQLTKAIVQPGITLLPRELISGFYTKTDDSTQIETKISNYPQLREYIVADTVTRLSTSEIADCPSLERLDISSGTLNIMHYVVGNNFFIPIKELEIPSGVTSIGNCAFNMLNKLESLSFEEGFNVYKSGTSQWESAFRAIDNLKTVTLPSSLDKLGSYFFSGLYKLEKIVVLNPNMVFEDKCFNSIPTSGTVVGYRGSTAETYARSIGWNFEEISSDDVAVQGMTSEFAAEQAASIDKIYVLIKSGEYFLSEPLEFDYRDSSDINVIYTSYGEGETVIHGGMEVGSWQVYDADKNVYRAYVGKDVNSRQFFVDGVRATRARQQGALKNCYIDGGSIVCDNTELLNFEYPQDMEITFHHAWNAPICGVDSVEKTDDDKVRVNMASEVWNMLQTRGTPYAKYPYTTEQDGVAYPWSMYSYENAYELLDEEGEWYLNTHDGYLYYKPRKFENIETAKAVLPITEQLVKIVGTEYLPVKNIEFNDIKFAYTTWLYPTEHKGYASGQNNTLYTDASHNYSFADAAVQVDCASNIDFIDCTFTKLGSVALKLRKGVQDCDIVGNEVYDISGNGICLGGQRAEEDNMPTEDMKNKNNTVANNYIHKIGVDYHGGSGLSTTYAQDTVVRNNEIFDVSYMGIHMGHIYDENYIAGLNVKDNYVHDTGNNMVETCPIYTFSSTAGTDEKPNVISGNYTAYNWGRTGSIGNDHGVSNLIIKNNVLDSTHSWKCADDYGYYYLRNWRASDTGFGNADGGNIIIDNNYGTQGAYTDKSIDEYGVVTNHHLCEFAVWPDEAKKIISSSGLEREYSLNAQDSVREIIIDEEKTIRKGKTEKISYFACGEKFEKYIGDNLQMYCYSDDPGIASVNDDGVITGIGTGVTNIRVCFKCGDLLKQYTVKVTVK